MHPVILTATPMPAILLTWTPDAKATGYRIFRGVRPGAEQPTPLATVAALSYLDTNVTPGVTYYYAVNAVNNTGQGPRSNEASAVITVPGVVTGSTAANLALASSVNPSVNGSAVTIYAAVAPALGSSTVPTGTVTFSVDGANQTPAATLVNGLASVSVSLTTGSRVIGAAYSGDTVFAPKTAVLTQSVGASFVAPWQPTGTNVVTTYGLVGDGVTDNATAKDTMLATVPDATLLYFPAGTYLSSTSWNFTTRPLRNWGMIGDADSTGAPTSILKTTTNSIKLINTEYDGGGGIYQCRNMQFVASNTGGTAFSSINSEAGCLWENCVFKGFIAFDNEQGFDPVYRHCTFTGPGSITNQAITQGGAGTELVGYNAALGTVSIGLLLNLPTAAVVDDCTISGFSYAVRAAGSGASFNRCAISACSVAFHLGADPTGVNYSLGGCSVLNTTITACDAGLYCQNINQSFFHAVSITGSTSAPSGQSQFGIWTSAKISTYSGLTISGSHSTAGLFIHAATNYSAFYANGVSNTLGQATIQQAGTTSVTISPSAVPNLITPFEDITPYDTVAGVRTAVNMTASGLVGDGGTDNSATLQALVAAWVVTQAATGAVPIFYFPKGNWGFGATVDFSALTRFEIVGDGSQSTTILGLSVAGNGFVAPQPVFRGDFSPGAGSIRIRGVKCQSGMYWKNLALSSIADSVASGTIGLQLINPANCCLRSVSFSGGNFDRAGLVASNVQYLTVEASDALGQAAAIQISGTGVRLYGDRFEVNRTGLSLGIDANGNAAAISGVVVIGNTNEANDTAVSLANCTSGFFAATGSQGHENAPAGVSALGFVATASSNGTMTASNYGGAYTAASYRIAATAHDLLFAAVQAGNSFVGGAVFDNQGANVGQVSFLTV